MEIVGEMEKQISIMFLRLKLMGILVGVAKLYLGVECMLGSKQLINGLENILGKMLKLYIRNIQKMSQELWLLGLVMELLSLRSPPTT